MRIAAYCRVSTEEQAMHGLSIEAQQAALEEWGGDQIVDHYIDLGISARKPASKRPELQRLLRDIEAGKIDLVAFTKLDRWFRSVKEYYKVQDILEAHNVAWRAIQEDYETETASGRFKVNIMLSVAQDEADRTGERVKTIFEGKRQRGEVLGGKPAYGLIRDGKGQKAGEDAPKVRALFDRYIATRSLLGVAKESEQITGQKLTYNHVKDILANPHYVAAGVIDQKQFDEVKQMRRERAPRSTRPDNVYLFAGLVFCSICGHRMSWHKRETGRPYCYCRAARLDEMCPNRRSINEQKLEQFLLDNIGEKAAEAELVTRAKKAQPVDVGAIRRRMDKLTDLLLDDLITPEKYEKEYRELQNRIKQAETIKAAVTPAEMGDILAIYPGLSREAKKAFWHTAIDRIEIDDAGGVQFALRTVETVREWIPPQQ